jgi:hypothetical protein
MGAVCYSKEPQIYNGTGQIPLVAVYTNILRIFAVSCSKISLRLNVFSLYPTE